MFVAKSEKSQFVVMGSELQPQCNNVPNHALGQELVCPVCSQEVKYQASSPDQPFNYFTHADGSSDCFESEAMSDEHRLAVEVATKVLHNRLRTVSGETVEIDVEKWIGSRPNFVITDIRITYPIRVAAEVFYMSERLGLRRRLKTMFDNNYRTYLIFHSSGRYDVNRVEQYVQKVAQLDVGRFNPATLELTLGDLISEQQLDLTHFSCASIPNYIYR